MKNGYNSGRKIFLKISLPTMMLTLALAALQGCQDAGSTVKAPAREQARLKEPVTIEPLPLPIGDDVGFCTADYAPVCGADAKTYSNACEATSHKTRIVHTGECR